MKRCPVCKRNYNDDSMSFCLDDGSELLFGPASGGDEPATAILHSTAAPGEALTRSQIHTTEQTAVFPRGSEAEPQNLGGLTEKQSFSARRAKPLIVAAVALAVLVGGFFGYKYLAPTKQIESIAVMPFVNESGNADVEYLSDGMTETLIGSLTKVPNLNVKARSSVFRYKGKETDAKTLGTELKVQAILNGRVAQRGDQFTLSLELVDVATENAIWSQQYTRKQTDLVSLQSEIARDVSNNLQSRLSGTEVAKVQKTYTADPEAYQLYLKGRFHWNRRTGESLKQAAAFFEQAIAKDPNYALAYSASAENYVLFPNYGVGAPTDSMPKAKAAALQASEIDDSLAEPHAALGLYYSNYSWNLPLAEKELRRAIELNPNYATAYHWLGNVLASMQRGEEAIIAARRAEELDPLSSIISADTGWDFYIMRRYDEAITQLQRTLQLDPNFSYAYYTLGQAYFGKGMYKEAVQAIRRSIELNEGPYANALLVMALAKAGDRAGAVKLRNDLKAESTDRYVQEYVLAIASAAVGETDEAIALLEKEIAERGVYVSVIAIDPMMDDLRTDPRFSALVKKVESSKLD